MGILIKITIIIKIKTTKIMATIDKTAITAIIIGRNIEEIIIGTMIIIYERCQILLNVFHVIRRDTLLTNVETIQPVEIILIILRDHRRVIY
jgi:hypothetical protein